MRIIVAGGRNCNDWKTVLDAIESSPFEIDTIIAGAARGVDSLARNYATITGANYEEFPAKWNLYGKKAGFLRNKEMADVADGLIAVWDGESRGTRMMIEIMNQQKKPVHLFLYKNS